MPLLQAFTGNEVVNDSFIKIHLFHSPHPGGAGGEREVFINSAAKTVPTDSAIQAVGRPTVENALTNIRPEIGGRWFRQSYEIQEGEVLKLFVQKRAAWGKLTQTACFFMQMRKGAALRKLSVRLLCTPQSRHSVAELIGCFDLLPLDYARDLGVKILGNNLSCFSQEQVAKLVAVSELEPEQAPLPRVSTQEVVSDTGEKHRITVRRKLRSLG